MAQPEGGSYICPASAPPVTAFRRLAAGHASGVGGLGADCPEIEILFTKQSLPMAQPEGGSYICPASAPPVTVFRRFAAGYATS